MVVTKHSGETKVRSESGEFDNEPKERKTFAKITRPRGWSFWQIALSTPELWAVSVAIIALCGFGWNLVWKLDLEGRVNDAVSARLVPVERLIEDRAAAAHRDLATHIAAEQKAEEARQEALEQIAERVEFMYREAIRKQRKDGG